MTNPFPKTSPGTSGLQLDEPLLFERPPAGRVGVSLPATGVAEANPRDEIPADLLREEIDGLPVVGSLGPLHDTGVLAELTAHLFDDRGCGASHCSHAQRAEQPMRMLHHAARARPDRNAPPAQIGK